MHIKQNYTAKCLRVIDGDTIFVQMDCPSCGDSKKMRIRLSRIDAPERGVGCENRWNASLQFLRGLVESKECVISLSQKWPDKYGRLIAEVLCDGKNVSNEMMAAGFAKLYLRRGSAAYLRDAARETDSHLDDFKWCGAEGTGGVEEA
jgi:endonuclease YncB( thermonuclease family)